VFFGLLSRTLACCVNSDFLTRMISRIRVCLTKHISTDYYPVSTKQKTPDSAISHLYPRGHIGGAEP
jgi:hypothetical protein